MSDPLNNDRDTKSKPLEWRDVIDISSIQDDSFRQKVEAVLDFRFSEPDAQEQLKALKARTELTSKDTDNSNAKWQNANQATKPDSWPDNTKFYISDSYEAFQNGRIKQGSFQSTTENGLNVIQLDQEDLKTTAYVTKELEVFRVTLNEIIEHELIGHGTDTPNHGIDYVRGKLSKNIGLELRDFLTESENTKNIQPLVSEYDKYNLAKIDEFKLKKDPNHIPESLGDQAATKSFEERKIELILQQKQIEDSINDTFNTPKSLGPLDNYQKSLHSFMNQREIGQLITLELLENPAVDATNKHREAMGLEHRDHYLAQIDLKEAPADILYYTSKEEAQALDRKVDYQFTDSEKAIYTRMNSEMNSERNHSENITNEERNVILQTIDALIHTKPQMNREMTEIVKQLTESAKETSGDDISIEDAKELVKDLPKGRDR